MQTSRDWWIRSCDPESRVHLCTVYGPVHRRQSSPNTRASPRRDLHKDTQGWTFCAGLRRPARTGGENITPKNKLKHIKINFIKFRVLLKFTIVFMRNNSQEWCLLPLARPLSHVAASWRLTARAPFPTWPAPAICAFKRTSGKFWVAVFIYKIQMLFHPIECAKTANTLRRSWKVAPSRELPLYVETLPRKQTPPDARGLAWCCVTLRLYGNQPLVYIGIGKGTVSAVFPCIGWISVLAI